MKTSPDHIFIKIRDNADYVPANDMERELRCLLKGGEASHNVTKAYEIFMRPIKKEIVEAFLLVETLPKELEEIVRVPQEVTRAYLTLFFDAKVFEDELDRLDYAYNYAESYGKDVKRYAVDLGKECMKIRYGRGSYTVTSREVQNGTRSMAYLMAQLVKRNPLDSSVAKEALRWAQVGLRASEGDDKSVESSVENLMFELQKSEETTNEEECGIPRDQILR